MTSECKVFCICRRRAFPLYNIVLIGSGTGTRPGHATGALLCFGQSMLRPGCKLATSSLSRPISSARVSRAKSREHTMSQSRTSEWPTFPDGQSTSWLLGDGPSEQWVQGSAILNSWPLLIPGRICKAGLAAYRSINCFTHCL